MHTFVCAFLLVGASFTASAPAVQGFGPSPELMKLEGMVGSWTGTIKFQGPGMPPDPCETTVKQEAVLGGMYYKTVYTVSLPGMPALEGHSMLGYDPEQKKYVSWTFDNMAFSPREESGTLDGTKLVMVSKPQGGTVTRSTFDLKGKDELYFSIEMKTGETWSKVGECSYRRKKS